MVYPVRKNINIRSLLEFKILDISKNPRKPADSERASAHAAGTCHKENWSHACQTRAQVCCVCTARNKNKPQFVLNIITQLR